MTRSISFVLLSAAAEEQFLEMKRRCDRKPSSAVATMWRAIERILRNVLTEPAILRSTAHRLRGVPDVYRVHVGQRGRLFYVGSAETQIVCVLFLGTRAAGDRDDSYEELTRRLRSDEFDDCFEAVGVAKPDV